MNHSKRSALLATVAMAAAVSTLGATAVTAQAVPPPATRDAVPLPAQANPHFAAVERAASAGVSSTRASRQALAAVQARVAAYVAKNGTAYSFATYADPKGTVIVETDAPATVSAAVTNVKKDRSLAGVTVQTRRAEKVTALTAGLTIIPPLYGGAGLAGGNRVCTSGYPVKSASGTRSMVIAGHCFANGTPVYSNNQSVGTVTGTSFNPDAALLQGGLYAGRIRTGGVASGASRPIVAAGSASVGYTNYCHSGRTTGERCGHTATSVTAQLCTAVGCKFPVIRFTGGVMPQGGDAGSPFYAKDSAGGAWIRGHVIGGSSTVSYVETYNKVAAHYGVTVVTG
jgi:hypothetical protein